MYKIMFNKTLFKIILNNQIIHFYKLNAVFFVIDFELFQNNNNINVNNIRTLFMKPLFKTINLTIKLQYHILIHHYHANVWSNLCTTQQFI